MPQHEQLSLRIARPEPNVNDVQQQTNARIDQDKHHRGAAILSGAELQASSQPRTNKCVPHADANPSRPSARVEYPAENQNGFFRCAYGTRSIQRPGDLTRACRPSRRNR